MVTVELAIGFVTLLGLLLSLVGIVQVGLIQAGANRASSEVARQLSRGDEAAAQQARDQAPPGAVIETQNREGGVEVDVTVPVKVFGLNSFDVEVTSWSPYEAGVEQ